MDNLLPFKEIAEDLITKPEGRPTLAKTDDKRPEYFPNGSAEKDFQGIDPQAFVLTGTKSNGKSTYLKSALIF